MSSSSRYSYSYSYYGIRFALVGVFDPSCIAPHLERPSVVADSKAQQQAPNGANKNSQQSAGSARTPAPACARHA